MAGTASEDEWEEVIVVAEVNGVLDAALVRKAVEKGHVNLRDASTATPILQISNSLYTGKWMRTVGTNIILEAENNQMKILSTTDKMLKTEKALLTAKEDEKNKKHTSAIKEEGEKVFAEVKRESLMPPGWFYKSVVGDHAHAREFLLFRAFAANINCQTL